MDCPIKTAAEKGWWQLTIVAGGRADFISDFLLEQGAVSVTLIDGGDQPLFQEALYATPLWQDTRVRALFADEITARTATDLLGGVLEWVADQDWVRMTQQNFPARLFGDRLWVAPPWQPVLRLNPGLGFGTGAHPTTALCLNWLAQQNLRGKTVVDYGCGSGILGLAALALGAETVWAVDHDPQALIATQDNAQLNHFSDSTASALKILLPEQFPKVTVDLVLANILANPLCELADRIMACLGEHAQLVLSGFLVEETQQVLQAYQPQCRVTDMATEENWVRAVLTKSALEQ